MLIEALASGLPVISTRSGGPEIIVHDANGHMVDTDNVEDLSKAMLYMASNAQTYNPSLIREDCIKRFGEDSVIRQIVNIYDEVRNL